MHLNPWPYPLLPWVMASLSLATACVATVDDATAACPAGPDGDLGLAEEPLFAATAQPAWLELDDRGQNAIVALVLDGSPPGLCTGVLIAPTLVLTAAHCATARSRAPEVRVGRDVETPQWSAQAERVQRHEELDLALLWLPWAVPTHLARPLPALRSALDLVDQRGQLAGFGLTERNTAGLRLFTDEVVIDQQDGSVTVDGEGARGACLGDSGGPLLVRDPVDRVRVAGILSQGSDSCHDLDRYVLLSPAADWLERALGRACNG